MPTSSKETQAINEKKSVVKCAHKSPTWFIKTSQITLSSLSPLWFSCKIKKTLPRRKLCEKVTVKSLFGQTDLKLRWSLSINLVYCRLLSLSLSLSLSLYLLAAREDQGVMERYMVTHLVVCKKWSSKWIWRIGFFIWTEFGYKLVCSPFPITHYVAIHKTIHVYF